MHTHTLFRDGQPIAQDTAAGYLHDIGKPGDILVITVVSEVTCVFAWLTPVGDGGYWRTLPIDAYTPEMQLNLLLLQGTLPTGKALLGKQIIPIP